MATHLKHLLIDLRITQRLLARNLKVDPARISKICCGRVRPRHGERVAICKFLDLSQEQVFPEIRIRLRKRHAKSGGIDAPEPTAEAEV